VSFSRWRYLLAMTCSREGVCLSNF
jgi:hypothetical protein